MPSTFDIDHAAFVRQEFRTDPKTNPAVKARNVTGAREVAFDTNSDATNASRIATAILADNIKPRAFEVELEGTLGGSSLVGGPPAYSLNSAKWELNGYYVKSFSISEDYDRNVTVVQVRG
jgi:hypothetical protein